MSNLKDLIYECVTNDVQFQSGPGAMYNVHHLVNTVSPNTLEEMFSFYDKKLERTSRRTLRSGKNTEQDTLNLRLNTLQAIYDYKMELANEKRQAAIRRKEIEEEVQILKELRTKKHMEELGKKGLDTLDKRIAELEKELG